MPDLCVELTALPLYPKAAVLELSAEHLEPRSINACRPTVQRPNWFKHPLCPWKLQFDCTSMLENVGSRTLVFSAIAILLYASWAVSDIREHVCIIFLISPQVIYAFYISPVRPHTWPVLVPYKQSSLSKSNFQTPEDRVLTQLDRRDMARSLLSPLTRSIQVMRQL